MTALSFATWIGRPVSEITPSARETEELRTLASVDSQAPAEESSLQWEVVQLTLDCTRPSASVQVAHHQHQIQFKFVDCPELTESAEAQLTGLISPDPLTLFKSDRAGLLDSEIVQLQEGVNTFQLQWESPQGKTHQLTIEVHRGRA